MSKKIIGLIIALVIVLLSALIYYFYFYSTKTTFTSEPNKVKVNLDGKNFVTPKTIRLKNGLYDIKVERAGYKTFTGKARIARNKKTIKINLESKNPNLDKELPYDVINFKVEPMNDSGVYMVTLHAILNHEWQKDAYKQQLKDFQQEALEWIKSKATDFSSVQIKWVPNPDEEINK